jgi:hypothetical protein
MKPKIVARLVLLASFLGLGLECAIRTPQAWIAAWALIVLISGVGFAIWSEHSPSDGRYENDRGLLCVTIFCGLMIAGLVISLAHGLGLGRSLVSIPLSMAGFILAMMTTIFAELQNTKA